jgi:hypothetical protein
MFRQAPKLRWMWFEGLHTDWGALQIKSAGFININLMNLCQFWKRYDDSWETKFGPGYQSRHWRELRNVAKLPAGYFQGLFILLLIKPVNEMQKKSGF